MLLPYFTRLCPIPTPLPQISLHGQSGGLSPPFPVSVLSNIWGAVQKVISRVQKAQFCIRDNQFGSQRVQKGRICTRESNDGGRNPRFAPVQYHSRNLCKHRRTVTYLVFVRCTGRSSYDREAEQRHSPRRIAKHPEQSGLLPQFGQQHQ